jgi:type I restriction enzyme S subunit
MNFENLPETWKVVRLGMVADIILGKTPHRKRRDYWDKGTIPWVKIQDMTHKVIMDTSEKITSKAFQEIFCNNFIPKGTLLMSFKLTIGRTAFLGIDAVHNEAIVSIFPNENLVDKRYLFYLLPSLNYLELAGGAAKGETLNKEKIKQLLISLPPLPEQKRIVEILSLAEEMIRKQKEAIALIDKILMAKFLEMFGDPATNPKGWEVERLGKMISVKPGFAFKSADYQNEGIPLIRIGDIKNGFVDLSETVKLPKEYATEYKDFVVNHGDILVALSGATAGKVGRFVLKEKALLNQRVGLMRIIKPEFLIKEYVFYFLSHRYFYERVWSFCAGGAQPNVSPKQIESISIPLPPIDLQQQFAKIVEEFENKREEMQKTLKTLESLFKLLQKKAFTGELTADWREKNNIQWEIPKITERQAILLAGIYYHQNLIQKPAMVTVVMKSAFLLQQEAGLNLNYDFIPYKYGPFSKEVYKDIEELQKNLLVERVKPKKDLEITEIKLIDEFNDWAERIIKTLSQEIKDTIKSYTDKYGRMELNELLEYVYDKYPKYAVKSKRKMGRR